MKASESKLLTILKGPKQFVIPIYQRAYSWQLAQCNQLLNDILRISKDPSTSGHFIGSVVYFQENIHTQSDVPKLLIIDGQQRVTTVSLLITALAHFLKRYEIIIDTNPTKLLNYYLLNSEEEGDLHYKLLLTKRDKQTLINIIKGIDLPYEDSQRVVENYEFFKSKITAENATSIYNGVLQLFVVEVALEKGVDNPQMIFESMNSTGLDLSQADLIRNYILMGQEIKLQNDLYENYWYPMEQSYGNDYTLAFNAFMRDYLSVKTGTIPRMDKVYEEFKQYVQGSKSPAHIEEVVADIYKFSDYYVTMVFYKIVDKDLNQAFRNISKLKVDVSYPFLLPIYSDFVEGTISREDFIKVLNLVESYVFRRAICGIPTNSLNKTFVTLYKSINKENYLESLKAVFQLMDGYKRFPADAEFEKEIVIKDVYNFRSRNYLLNKLENENRKELVNTEDYTIEHIMPQNTDLSDQWKTMLGDKWKDVHQMYLHTLGNLTLTGYNSELSDRPFSLKKSIEGGFNDSPLRLNAYMRNTDKWNEETIEKRGKQLATKAASIWQFPFVPADVLNKYKATEEREPSHYTIDSYDHLKGEMLDIYYAFRKRVLNMDATVKEEYKKLYIAFKSSTNFVDVVPQKSRLRLSLNIDYADIIDPKGLCRDVTNLGRWGNGDVETGLNSISQLNDVMELVQQAFEKQMESI